MARYIDADKLERLFDRESFHTPDERWRPESEFAFFIDYAETEDVAPVVHAHWVKNPRWVEWSCTNCNAVQQRCTRYCGWCGAKMDEAVE